MNITIKNLIERRSVRSFNSMPIKEIELNEILKAGTYAPSGRNSQSAKIVVVRNADLIKKLSKINASFLWSKTNAENIDPFYGSSTLIIVFADKNVGTYIEDGSLVLGNIMNAAYSLGIGSCWVHRAKETFETKTGKELLKSWNISENYVGIGNCVLGYPLKDTVLQPSKRKSDYITYID